MSIERDDELDRCPNCKSPYEIAAVKLSIMRETSALFVCTSCRLARAEAPSTPAPRPRLAWRIAIGLIVTAPAVLYVAMRLLAFEHQPVPTSNLAVSIEQSSSHL
jgi:uncharacterized membrane protein